MQIDISREERISHTGAHARNHQPRAHNLHLGIRVLHHVFHLGEDVVAHERGMDRGIVLVGDHAFHPANDKCLHFRPLDQFQQLAMAARLGQPAQCGAHRRAIPSAKDLSTGDVGNRILDVCRGQWQLLVGMEIKNTPANAEILLNSRQEQRLLAVQRPCERRLVALEDRLDQVRPQVRSGVPEVKAADLDVVRVPALQNCLEPFAAANGCKFRNRLLVSEDSADDVVDVVAQLFVRLTTLPRWLALVLLNEAAFTRLELLMLRPNLFGQSSQ